MTLTRKLSLLALALAAVVLTSALAPAPFGRAHASGAPHARRHPAITNGKRWGDVPWCNPEIAKPNRQLGIVWAWAGVHCSADFKEIWWWVEANMYSHVSHRWVSQGVTKVHFNGRPTRFEAATAYAHCRWWGYPGGSGKNRRNWQTLIRVDGVLAMDPGNKIRMYDHEDTTLACVGRVAR